MLNTVIKQLEKALQSKDDKELRVRIEILLDFLREQNERPIVPAVANTPQATKAPIMGAFVGGEELPLKRPEGM